VPNKLAKLRKQKRMKLNKKLSIEGRTSKQYRKWKEKQNSDSDNKFGVKR
jgi:hypothetical protein